MDRDDKPLIVILCIGIGISIGALMTYVAGNPRATALIGVCLAGACGMTLLALRLSERLESSPHPETRTGNAAGNEFPREDD